LQSARHNQDKTDAEQCQLSPPCGLWVSLKLTDRAFTEPSADRGPQRGSPAGVVDAPDASVNLNDAAVFRHNIDFDNRRPFVGCCHGATMVSKVTVDASIRRYRARFCNGTLLFPNKPTTVRCHGFNFYCRHLYFCGKQVAHEDEKV
jgi:hypothetical protein